MRPIYLTYAIKSQTQFAHFHPGLNMKTVLGMECVKKRVEKQNHCLVSPLVLTVNEWHQLVQCALRSRCSDSCVTEGQVQLPNPGSWQFPQNNELLQTVK